MKISKDSWHYRTLTDGLFWLDGWVASNSLCLYFWQVFFRLLMGFGIAMVATSPLVFYIVGVMELYAPEHMALILLLLPWVVCGLVVSVVGGVIVAMLCIGLVFYAIGSLLSWLWGVSPLNKYIKKAENRPSIIVEYVKAKKDKVCPILEFED